MTSSAFGKKRWLFWLGLLGFNVLLLLPAFVANWEQVSFWPSTRLDETECLESGWIWLVRDNMDLFRLCGEWLLLLGAWLLLRPWKWPFRIARILGVGGYLALLTYQIYFAGSLSIYGQHPYFQNDFVLANEVLPIFLDQVSGGSDWIYVWLIGGTLLGLGIIGTGLWWFSGKLKETKLGWGHLGGYAALLLTLFGTSWGVRNLDLRNDYFTSLWITPLMQESSNLPNAEKFDRLPKLPLYENYLQRELANRPNIYLLFVESYGRAAATKVWVKDDYTQAIRGIQDTLDAAGWKNTSGYSVAPILGGKSWLSFTTVMSGVKLENHVHFTQLLERYPDYPHLFRYLDGQGYQTFRMKTFSKQKASTKDAYAFQQRFFDFDRWIKHEEIPYQGFEYDFHGGIPDQYAMGYFHEGIEKDTTQPEALFFISMASHVPWFPPPPVVDDWRQLDSIQDDPWNIDIPDSVTRRYDRFMARLGEKLTPRYLRTVLYDLRAFSQFIREDADPNSIFIVLGDHQAPMVTYYGGDGLEVPVHIISRDTTFLKGFEQYGFQPGMEADTTLPAPLNHEGLYSLFMRELLRNYGRDTLAVPVFLPEGI